MYASGNLRIEVLIVKDPKGDDSVGHVLLTLSSKQPEFRLYQRNARILKDMVNNGDGIVKFNDPRSLRETVQDLVNCVLGVANAMYFEIEPDIKWYETDIHVFNIIFGLAKERYSIRR